MKAKKFLGQVRKLDTMIKNKLVEKEQWKAVAMNTTSKMDGDRVQSSGRKQKMAESIEKYIDMEREINKEIDNLVFAKREVIRVIEQLNTTEYDILHKRYIQGLSLMDIANNLDRTYSSITSIHGRALKNVQDILDTK